MPVRTARRMSLSDIPRRRLQRLGLARPWPGTPQSVVGRLAAVQAQDFAGAKWAVGMRLKGVNDAQVERAFDDGAILRTHVLRPTWHFVTPQDIRALLALTGPRVHLLNATMYRRLGLEKTDFERAHLAITRALQGGRSLTRDELGGVLQRAGIETESGQRLAYVMMHAELEGLVCSGPRRGKQFTYALLEERVGPVASMDRGQALAELARRYFLTRGPATVHDFAKWSGLTVAEARRGLESATAHLHSAVIDGETYWFSPEAKPPVRSRRSALLVSIYDEYISSYRDRRAIVDEHHASRLVGMGNALTAAILIGGRIVGTWKRTLSRDRVIVETRLFRRMTKAEKAGVAAAAAKYGRFLGLPARLS